MRTSSSRRLLAGPAHPVRLAAGAFLVAAAAAGVASCGGGSSQSNPPPPVVRIEVAQQFLDVGQRYELDGSGTTDPNGNFEDIIFSWRIISGGLDTVFDDHCQADFDEICDSNDDDHCSNDTTRFCNNDDDCQGFGFCELNSGTTSSDCSEGICGLGQGDEGDKATFVANVAGPYTVRLNAQGTESNGTKSVVLDTYPSLYVVGSLLQFGGTGGAALGAVADAAEFATGASEGASDPKNGDLVIIDDDLHLVRVFDLRSGTIEGPFGESDRFVSDPAALAFHPESARLYVAEESGRVLIFDDTTGLLVTTFGNVGAGPLSMAFSPSTGDLLVVHGTPGSGVRAFGPDGTDKGVLGQTGSAVTEAVDLAFLPAGDLLVADRTGRVVRCNGSGNACGAFSSALDGMLEAGSPSAIAVNPSADYTDREVMVADPEGERVISCTVDGEDCEDFGDTADADSAFLDVFFAPNAAPTTTTSTSTTTSTTLEN